MQEAASSNQCVEAEYSFQAKITEEENIEIVEEQSYEENVEGKTIKIIYFK